MKDAKDLHADITRLLLTVNQLREMTVAAQQNDKISIEVGGGSF
jgi:outer membrane murein-binding lipoprotein Lpp